VSVRSNGYSEASAVLAASPNAAAASKIFFIEMPRLSELIAQKSGIC
jgi:hypothetical protein